MDDKEFERSLDNEELRLDKQRNYTKEVEERIKKEEERIEQEPTNYSERIEEIKKAISEEPKKFNIGVGSIVGGIIVIFVGISLIPTIKEELTVVSAGANITGVSSTIFNLAPLFFGLAIMAGGIVVVASFFRRTGLTGGDDFEDEEEEDLED